MVNIIHKPHTAYIYKSPKPEVWEFPKVEAQMIHSLEWCLPWMIISEHPVKGFYKFLKELKQEGRFWNPITVWTLPDGSFHLWHGRSRYLWSKVLDVDFDVTIIDQYGVDVTTQFPDAVIHPADNITVDYHKRKQENGEIVFKMVLRNEDRKHHDDADKMMTHYAASPTDCVEYDEMLRTKPGLRFYVQNKFMFKWGNDNNTVDIHYDNVVDCLRRTMQHWELI